MKKYKQTYLYIEVNKYNKNEKKKKNIRMIIWFLLHILDFCCDLWSVWMKENNKIFILKHFKEDQIERLEDDTQRLIREKRTLIGER